MKKLIITSLLMITMTTGSALAYSNKVKVNTDEYINMLNTSISEMRDELEPREKATIGSTLWNGIEDGYIKPSINNDTDLMNCVSGLVSNIKNTDIMNKSLQDKHNELMVKMEELTKLLNDSIECKKEILNSDEKSLTKGQMVLTIDDDNMKLVNTKIDEINNLYKEINDFIK